MKSLPPTLPGGRIAECVIQLAVVVVLMATSSGCQESRDRFTQGRLEKTCESAIPVCDSRAGCVVSSDHYLSGSFPGGRSVVVRTDTADNRLVVRFLLERMVSDGTELQLRAYSPDCNDFSERHPTDVDLFERAGDDRILQFEMPLEGSGDHLLTIFSDMGAEYLMTATPEQSD